MKTIPKALRPKLRRKILVKAAKPLIKSARSKINDSKYGHVRYLKNGTPIDYLPGNLKKSIRVLPLRKTADAFVGPKVSRGSGPFGIGRKVDGYYAHWVHDGTDKITGSKFMLLAAEDSASKVLDLAAKGMADLLNKQIKKISKR